MGLPEIWFNLLHLHFVYCKYKETTASCFPLWFLMFRPLHCCCDHSILSLASQQHQIRRPMMKRKMETMLWYLVAMVIFVAKGRRLVRRCQWCTDQSSKYEGYTICLMSRHLSQSWLMYHVQNISRLLATPTADKAILHLVLSPFIFFTHPIPMRY